MICRTARVSRRWFSYPLSGYLAMLSKALWPQEPWRSGWENCAHWDSSTLLLSTMLTTMVLWTRVKHGTSARRPILRTCFGSRFNRFHICESLRWTQAKLPPDTEWSTVELELIDLPQAVQTASRRSLYFNSQWWKNVVGILPVWFASSYSALSHAFDFVSYWSARRAFPVSWSPVTEILLYCTGARRRCFRGWASLGIQAVL